MNEKFKSIMQIIFLILLMIAIGALINTTITIYRYRDMLQNPVGYNIEKFGLQYCTCYDTENKIVPIQGPNLKENLSEYLPFQNTNCNNNLDVSKLNFSLPT